MIVVFLLSTAAYAINPQIHTRFGAIEGRAVTSRFGPVVHQFTNIPYALPPTGVRRFADTVDWNARFAGGHFEATRVGIQCPQPEGAEDCLYLNIWTPAGAADANASLPVLLFVHGGSFINGNGDQYNGTALVARQHVVLVTINYRLDHLGWLVPVAGHRANFGLQDQRSAMHLISPASDGLYTTALMESGIAAAKSSSYAAGISRDYLRAAGCDAAAPPASVLACLRAAPLATLQAAALAAVPRNNTQSPFASRGWSPSVDGDEIPQDPLQLLAAGRVNRRASLVAGSNHDEGTVFVFPYFPKGMDATAYRKFVEQMLTSGGRSLNTTMRDLVLHEYPAATGTGADNRALAARLAADYSFTCSTRYLARIVSSGFGPDINASAGRAFLYHFMQRAAADPSPTWEGVAHGSDVPFVFDQPSWEGDAGFTAEEEHFAGALGEMWARFAAVRGAPAPAWAPYTNGSDLEFVLRARNGSFSQRFYRATQCDFWEQFYAKL